MVRSTARSPRPIALNARLAANSTSRCRSRERRGIRKIILDDQALIRVASAGKCTANQSSTGRRFLPRRAIRGRAFCSARKYERLGEEALDKLKDPDFLDKLPHGVGGSTLAAKVEISKTADKLHEDKAKWLGW